MSKSTLSNYLRAGRPALSLHLLGVLLLAAGCASNAPSAHKAGASASAKTQASQTASAKADAAANAFDAQVQKAAAQPSAPLDGTGWKSLFDGKSLKGWQVTDFGGHGAVSCQSGLAVIEMGDALSGINYTNGNVPTVNYEVALDAIKLTGSDFFCGLTFPVKDSYATLILGGWGGAVVGISSIDGDDASENETSKFMRFDDNRWYRVRLRVTDHKIEAWLDNDQIVNLDTKGRQISLRFGDIDLSKPLGIATYQTTAAMRNIKLRTLEAGK